MNMEDSIVISSDDDAKIKSWFEERVGKDIYRVGFIYQLWERVLEFFGLFVSGKTFHRWYNMNVSCFCEVKG